jgi:hypothetical protein
MIGLALVNGALVRGFEPLDSHRSIESASIAKRQRIRAQDCSIDCHRTKRGIGCFRLR